MKWSESRPVMSYSSWHHRPYSPWSSPGQNTGVGSLPFLQGIFPTQGSNPGLPHCRQIFYQLTQKGSPRILGWVAYPFSSRFSQLRNWTKVSCIAGRFFTNWAIREAHSWHAAATADKSLQSCLTLCDSIDGSLPGSPVPGILQARTLEWVAIAFSNAWKWNSLGCVQLFATVYSMEVSRPEY